MKFTSILFTALAVVPAAGFTPPGTFLRFSSSSTQESTTTALNKFKVFIDGEAGTTGLQVRGRIEARDDLKIISAPDELRKDEATRKQLINEADAVILCKFRMF